MLRVGIHENLVLDKAQINDKGTLGLVFRPISLNKKEPSGFVEEEAAELSEGSNNSALLIFPPTITKLKNLDGSEKNDEEKLQVLSDDISNFKDQLVSIIGAYRSLKDVKFRPYDGTGVDKSNYNVEMLNNDTIKKVYTNYCNQFIGYITPFLGDDNNPVRLKLIRQSKDKHYATLPSRYLNTNPFIECMNSVPADKTKLRFTKWEMEKGFDSGEPVAQAKAADDVPEATPETIQGTFGKFD